MTSMFRRKRKSKAEKVEIQHYAPDVAMVPSNYVYPYAKERLANAKREIDDFLSNTQPVRFNSTFYDSKAEYNERIILEALREQTAIHSHSIILQTAKFNAELHRLLEEAANLTDEINKFDMMLKALQGGEQSR